MPNESADHLEAFRKHIEIERGLTCWSTYRYQLQGYLRFMDARRVNLLNATRDDVVAYLEEKKRSGLKASTLFLASVSVRLFHRFLVASGRAVTGPIDLKLPKVGERLPIPLNVIEMERLLAVTTGNKFHRVRMACALTVMWGTGMRVSELTGLTMEQINLEEQWIRVRGKGGRERIVPMGPQAKEALLHYLEVREGRRGAETNVLFLTINGRPWTRGPFWLQMQQLAKEAGVLGKVHPHRVRHTFGAILTVRGVPLRAIQENLGHRQITTTQIYTRISPEHIRETLQAAHPNF